MDGVGQVEACRLCANFFVIGADVDFVPLYEPIAGLEQQLQFLHNEIEAWQLNISIDDGLPQRVCANCFTQFCNIQTFQQQCTLAQQKLLQSFVGVDTVGQTNEATAADTLSQSGKGHQQYPQTTTTLTNGGHDAPVTSADLIATLDCLQPPPATTSADVIASLDGLQLPASVAETLCLLTQELSNMQNNAMMDTNGGGTANVNAITTNAIMDTRTEGTNVLQFTAASSTQNMHCIQNTPITAVATRIPDTSMPTTVVAASTNVIASEQVKDCDKTEIDLEDMLQGSVIPKNLQPPNIQPKVRKKLEEIVKEIEQENICKANTQNSLSSLEDFDAEEEMDYNSGSEPEDDAEDLDEDLELDADEGVQTRISRNPFACQYCYCPNSGSIEHLIFENSEELSQHFFDVHDPNLPYTCPYCSQKYSSAKQRDYHVRLQHPTNTMDDQCTYCKRIIRGPRELHEYTCNYISDWHCKICAQDFNQISLSRFRHHQGQHADSKRFRCRECGKAFLRKANWQAHERMHRPRSNYTIKCEQCNKVYYNDYEMRRHNYQAHNGELPVRCEYCMKGFVSMAFLSRHTEVFHPERKRSLNAHAATCTNCGCTFSTLHKLRLHIQRPRDENGRCMEAVRQIAPLQNGSKQIRRPRLHACLHCNKRFSTPSTLQKHMRTHGEHSFSCNECTLNFQNANDLKRHIADAHSRPRYLKCDQCDKRFFYMHELQQHVKMHAPDADSQTNKVKCSQPDCGFVATSTQAAYAHTLVKHKYVACEFCHKYFARNRLPTHLRKIHGTDLGSEEANNNTINRLQQSHTEDSLAVASILDSTTHNVQQLINNNDVMIAFNNTSGDGDSGLINHNGGTVGGDGGEKVRVELVQQQLPPISQIALHEEVQQEETHAFQTLIPTEQDDMDQSFLFSSLLDAEHEIIVT